MRKKILISFALTASIVISGIMPAYTDTIVSNTWNAPANPAEAMQTAQSFQDAQSPDSETDKTMQQAAEEAALAQQAQENAAQEAAAAQAAIQAQENAALEAQQKAAEQAAIQALEAQQAALEQAETQAKHAADIGNFFKDSVLVGDSVALGFSNYAVRNAGTPIFQNLKFLTAGSFSVHNAFMNISSKSKHPIYLGEQRFIWDSIKLMGAKHAYTFFGLNDLYAGVDDTAEKYVQLLQKIKEVNPDIEYTIISTTPMYKGSEKKNLNNANIRALNTRMAELAAQNGWGFIDIASLLTDADGTLAKQYCSDSYVHETGAAYVIWQKALEDYAEKQLFPEF